MADLRLRAVHAIQRLNSKKKVETIAPGALFNATDATQFKELTSGVNPAARPAPVESVSEEPAATTEPTEKPLSKMTKAELLTYAEENDIEVDSEAKVADLRAAIEAAEAGDGEDEDNLV